MLPSKYTMLRDTPGTYRPRRDILVLTKKIVVFSEKDGSSL